MLNIETVVIIEKVIGVINAVVEASKNKWIPLVSRTKNNYRFH